MLDVNIFDSMRIGLASPDKILQWSHGEVKKPETIFLTTISKNSITNLINSTNNKLTVFHKPKPRIEKLNSLNPLNLNRLQILAVVMRHIAQPTRYIPLNDKQEFYHN